MLPPVGIAVLLLQLLLHLGQLMLQILDFGLVGLGIEPLLQLLLLLFQFFDLPVYPIGIALPGLVLILFPLGPFAPWPACLGPSASGASSGCLGASAARSGSSK